MSAPNNAKYVLTEAHAALPNAVLFDAVFSTKTTDDLSEGSTNLYYTEARFNTSFSGKDSDDLSEGSTNLFFTNERVDDRVNSLIVAGTSLTSTYDDGAGTLTLDVDDDFLKNTGDTATGNYTFTLSSNPNFLIENVDGNDVFKISGVGSGNPNIAINNYSTFTIAGLNGTSFSITGAITANEKITVQLNPSSTNTSLELLKLTRKTTGTAAAGLGVNVGFYLEDNHGTEAQVGKIDLVWTNADNPDQTADMVFSTRRNNALLTFMTLDTSLNRLHFATNYGILFGSSNTCEIYTDGTNFIFDADRFDGNGKFIRFLSQKSTTGDPTGAEGMLYWNNTDNVLKMYCDGGWRTLASW